ncbi:MAG: nucleotidyltransferase family protein [Planctomycetes bacterium]|nr:nucleotidyltransferase family protein [Planctomycetota bacterium]
MTRGNFEAVVLAAGKSTRFGELKQLATVNGVPLVRFVCDSFRNAGVRRIVVVTGNRHDEVEAEIPDYATFVRNPEYEIGMVTSILRGVKAIADSGAPFFLTPTDVLVTPADVRRLIYEWKSSEPEPMAVVPSFGNRRGHPALFSSDAKDFFLRLGPDDRGNRVIDMFDQEGAVNYVLFPDDRLITSVNSKSDLHRVSAMLPL